MTFHLANHCPDMRGSRYRTKRWVLGFGAYGNVVLLVWANHLEDALDECIDWIAENVKGFLCDDEVARVYNDEIAKGVDSDTAWENATVDTTCGGNIGHWIHSWEWTILAENPDRKQLKEIIKQATR